MLKKTFLILVILLITNMFGISQVQNSIFLKGINGNEIKLSQLADTSVKLTTTIDLRLKEHTATIYLTGAGFPQTAIVKITINSSLAALKNSLRIGTSIIIEDLKIKNPKTGVEIFFKGSSYKVIAD